MLDLSKVARAFLESLPAKQYKQVVVRVHDLLANQEPHDVRLLSGHPGYKRIDQGEYRIVFYMKEGVIRVPFIGKPNNDEIYRQLRRR